MTPARSATAPVDLRIERADDEQPAPLRYTLLSVQDLEALPEPTPLIEGVLFCGTTVGIVGPYASYKSFVALGQALSIATGLDWHGRRVRQGVVVYVVGEGLHGIRRRVEAWRQLNRLPDVGGIFFLPEAVVMNDPRDLSDFCLAMAELPDRPVAVFIDTLARTLRGNENAVEDTAAYVRACDRIRRATGATICLVHHSGWTEGRSRGSSNIPASLDTELTLTRTDDQVEVKATKQKDAPEGHVVTLEAVNVAGSLAMRAVDPRSPILTPNERIALERVKDGPLQEKVWREASDLAKSSLGNARRRLESLGYVRHTKEGYMATDAGRLALGSRVNAGSTEGQLNRPGFGGDSVS